MEELITLIAFGIIAQVCFIYAEYHKKWKIAVILKGIAASFFVVIGIWCASRHFCTIYDKLIILGLIFGLIGDVCLNLRHVINNKSDKIFLSGIVAFLLGHIMYLIAVTTNAKHIFIDIIMGLIISTLLLTYIFKTMTVKLPFKIFGIFYLSIIIIMTCISIDNVIFIVNTKNILFACGAILFSASDIILIFNTFSGHESFNKRIANLSLYYIAQILIATTTLIIS